jgi:hypothetical protein
MLPVRNSEAAVVACAEAVAEYQTMLGGLDANGDSVLGVQSSLRWVTGRRSWLEQPLVTAFVSLLLSPATEYDAIACLRPRFR